MRKDILIFCLLAFMPLALMAQTKLNTTQKDQVVAKINKSTAAMQSMQCTFKQTKSMKMLSKQMVSSGMMYFKRPSKLRWQYTTPYDYTFIMNGDKVKIKSAKSTKNVNMQRDKMFKHITNIILSTMTGDGLKNSADFNTEIFQSASGHFARLYPKKKELKQIYKVIELYFNKDLTMVSSVKMEEKTGDVTVVKLNDVKTNTQINEKMFSTH